MTTTKSTPTVNIAKVKSRNQPNPGAFRSGLTSPAPIRICRRTSRRRLALTAPHETFNYGLDNAFLPNPIGQAQARQQRFVIGAKASWTVGTDWHYDAYYEHAMNTPIFMCSIFR